MANKKITNQNRKNERLNNKIKNEKNNTEVNAINSDEITRLIKIILVILVIAVLFYGVTVLVTKFKKDKVENRHYDDTPAIIQYDEILIGTLLDQPREEYYVLIQKEDDPYNSLFADYINSYKSKKDALKVYLSNMNHIFNQFHFSEHANINTNNIVEFKVSDVTLIKVKQKNIVETYQGVDEIEKALKELIK